YGSMAIDPASGTWVYTLDNAKAETQALKEGQSVTQTYVARVTDDKGAYVDQTITVTINGTNDVPVVTNAAAARTGEVIEAGHNDNGTVLAGVASATGTLTATDVDANATRIWTIVGSPGSTAGSVDAASTTYGSIAINASTGVWVYTLDNTKAATQALDDGDVVTQRYIARVTDDFGAYADQIVTVTVRGSNDAPTLTVGSPDPSQIVEDGFMVLVSNKQASLNMTRSDVDDAPSFVVSDWTPGSSSTVSNTRTETWTRQGDFGMATLKVVTNLGTGKEQLSMGYQLNDSLAETQSLSAGATDFDRFYIAVTDGNVVTTREAKFQLVGTDDALAWNPGTPSQVMIYRVAGDRAVVRLDLAATDVDSDISYQATLSNGTYSTSFEMIASGGSLLGLVNVTDVGGNYTLDVLAIPTGGDSALRSFTGTNVLRATAAPVTGTV
ncbi:MAG: hypothetical protein EB027_07225, partial [Actinobacteria bacterium]|nr:hypothetical protein [Actinomycetota bacterium]